MSSCGLNLKDLSCFLSGGKGLRLSSYRFLSFFANRFEGFVVF